MAFSAFPGRTAFLRQPLPRSFQAVWLTACRQFERNLPMVLLVGLFSVLAATAAGQNSAAENRPSLPSLFQVTPVDQTFRSAEPLLYQPVTETAKPEPAAAADTPAVAQSSGELNPAAVSTAAAPPPGTEDSADWQWKDGWKGNSAVVPVGFFQTATAQTDQPAAAAGPVVGATAEAETPAPDAAAVPAVAPVAVAAAAGAAETEPTAPLLTLEEVQAQKQQVEQSTELTEELRGQAVKLYQRAADGLKLAAEAARKTAELKAERDNSAGMLAEVRALLAEPLPPAQPEIADGTGLAELEQYRLADEVKADEARKNLETWEARSKVRAERKPQMPAIIEKARQQLADARKALEVPAAEGEPQVLVQARKIDQQALVQVLQQQLEQYRMEQLRYEALSEWFPLQRDYLTRSRNFAEKRLEAWKTAVAAARQRESERQAREARETLRNTHSALRDLATRNSELTQIRKELQRQINEAAANLTTVNRTLNEIEDDFQNVTEKEARAGLTTGIGLLLRNQRSHLPSADGFRRMREKAESQTVRLQLDQMQLEDERADLGDLDRQIQKTLAQIQVSGVPVTEEIEGMVLELMRDRRTYLDDLLTDVGTCLTTLAELDVSSRNLTNTIGEYENYIDERVLWIRSAAAVDTGTLQRMVRGARIVLAPGNWVIVGERLLNDVRERTAAYGLALIIGTALLAYSRRLRLLIRGLSHRQSRRSSVEIPATLAALGLTVILASAWPALMWVVGWRLAGQSTDDFSLAVAEALQITGIVFWSVEVFRQICRNQGIAETFLDWPESIIRSLHRNLRRLMIAGLPLVFLVAIAEQMDEGTWADSLGRTAFVAFCLLLAESLRQTVRPAGRGLGDVLRADPHGWMSRTRKIWYPIVVGAPLALATLALCGYVYTAEQLMLRLQLTLSLCVVLTIAYTLVTQWMLEARRQLAMEQARARRAAAIAAAAQQSGEGAGSTIPPVEEPQIDISLLNQQMLRLVQGTACLLFVTFGWMIWSQVLPALQVLNRVELWSTMVEVAESVDLGNGVTEIREVTRLQWVTLGGVILAIAMLSIAIVASRNLPGLLELAVLQRLPLDHGGRHAVTTMSRYALMLTGIVMACRTLGIGWSSVQWLVAALTVGLGFGLQEIFANFVSGLIILFERPVRIGDVVTIDGVSGSVSRIQIRATTITDWDRKEYIVPNKEFVTGRLLNWTLSDKTNRVMINVGVAYGTDTDLALALMLQVAENNPAVLTDPAPVTTFEGFGDSCLNLVLRCYLPNLDNRLKVITELHTAIDRAFRKATIEIAFPQRDLHLRTVAPNVATNPLEAPTESASSAERLSDADSGKSTRAA